MVIDRTLTLRYLPVDTTEIETMVSNEETNKKKRLTRSIKYRETRGPSSNKEKFIKGVRISMS